MLTSIIIPIYNGEKYIEECIESALNQTYEDIEIIVVDDGSTDGTSKILKKYEDKIKIITKENGGVTSAMNVGILNMKGEWFKLLGADDVLENVAVEELVKLSSGTKNKKNCIFVSDYKTIDSNGEIIGEIKHSSIYSPLDNFNRNVCLLDYFKGNAVTSFIHKSTLKSFGIFDEKFKIAPDYELWLRYCLIHNCTLQFVPKSLVRYRIHPKMLTNTIPPDKIKNEDDRIKEYILAKINPIERKKYEKALVRLRNKQKRDENLRRFRRTIIFGIFPKSFAEYLVNFVKKIKI